MRKQRLNAWKALSSGLVGASVLTATNEIARRMAPKAPRLDSLGRRAMAGTLRKFTRKQPEEQKLYRWALAGDLLSNSLFYGLVGAGGPRHNWRRGTLLGLGAGLGALLLPPSLRLGRWPTRRKPATKLMTMGWYLAGGLAAAAAAGMFKRK
jgi:hypothetical protein